MLESYHKLQPKQKTFPEFKDVLHLIWSVLLEKAIDDDNAVKLRREQIWACVRQCWTFSTYNVIIHITDTNS